MSNERTPDSARGYCTRASEKLRRASQLLEQTSELKQSIARLRVGTKGSGFPGASIPPTDVEPQQRQTTRELRSPPPTILVRGVDGVLRVKKD